MCSQNCYLLVAWYLMEKGKYLFMHFLIFSIVLFLQSHFISLWSCCWHICSRLCILTTWFQLLGHIIPYHGTCSCNHSHQKACNKKLSLILMLHRPQWFVLVLNNWWTQEAISMYPNSKVSFNMTGYLSYNIEYLVSSIKRKWSNLLLVHIFSFFSLIVLACFLLSGSEQCQDSCEDTNFRN